MGRSLKKQVSLFELQAGLGLEEGVVDVLIDRVTAVDKSTAGSLCFAKTNDYARQAHPQAIVITGCESNSESFGVCIIVEEPRLQFARALAWLESTIGFSWSDELPNIHQSAFVGEGVVLGRGVVIGENSIIHPNVVIGPEVKIGKNCIIKSGCVIGQSGFGFERDASGRAIRVPHIGGVQIGDDVEIGALNTVVRGTLNLTVVENGVKTDDHVHIAHNVHVGEHTLITACTEISGGVRIGKRVWLGPNSSIMNQISIGDDSLIGLGAVVTKSVEAATIVSGNPARFLKHK